VGPNLGSRAQSSHRARFPVRLAWPRGTDAKPILASLLLAPNPRGVARGLRVRAYNGLNVSQTDRETQ
jgi:hypothetical protein